MSHPDRKDPGIGRRVLLGSALYLVLGALWLTFGLDLRYDEVVLRAGVACVGLLTHFPIGASSIDPLTVHNQGFVFVLLVALALVVGRLRWPARAAKYGLLALAAFAAHVLGLALQLHLTLALRFQEKTQTALLLPWETEIVRRATQTCFITGLAVVPFLALALTAWWSGALDAVGASPASRAARPGVVYKVAGAGLLLVVVSLGAWWAREVDPRHVTGHLTVGNLLWIRGDPGEAERQYGTVLRWSGRQDASPALDQALGRVPDARWRQRLEQRLGRAVSAPRN